MLLISILSTDPTATWPTSRLLSSLNAWDCSAVYAHKARLLVNLIQHPRTELTCYWTQFDPVKGNVFYAPVQLN